jgi:CO dehydrogenase maturation factor
MKNAGEGDSRPVILFCGKGGVGKTTLSAMTIQLLCRRGDSPILAVDADPAMGLALTLGITPERSLDDILSDEDVLKGGRDEVSAGLDYEISRCLKESGNLSFIALGRPEAQGCFCAVNQLLKKAIEKLSLSFDAVVIDAEAGVEQINRRVFDAVTHLFVVTDPTKKGLMVADTILSLSRRSIRSDYCALILNRVKTGDGISLDPSVSFDSFCLIPEDSGIRLFDLHGGEPLLLTGTAAAARLASYLGDLKLL